MQRGLLVQKRERLESIITAVDLAILARQGGVTKEGWKRIDENFYRCSMEVYAGLGEMYVADPRFTKNIDKAGEGLAAYMRDGIRVYVAGRR